MWMLGNKLTSGWAVGWNNSIDFLHPLCLLFFPSPPLSLPLSLCLFLLSLPLFPSLLRLLSSLPIIFSLSVIALISLAFFLCTFSLSFLLLMMSLLVSVFLFLSSSVNSTNLVSYWFRWSLCFIFEFSFSFSFAFTNEKTSTLLKPLYDASPKQAKYIKTFVDMPSDFQSCLNVNMPYR